jgi:hypothetical protein
MQKCAWIGVTLSLALICTLPTVAVGKAVTSCAGIEIHWGSVGAATPPYQTNPPANMVMEGTEAFSPVIGEGLSKMLKIDITGPMLGDMDSREIKIDLSCTASGLIVTATITRAAGYTEGSYMHTVFWKPQVEIWLTLHRPEVILDGKWVMRLTDGKIIDHAKTYQLPEQPYPVKVSATIRANGILTLMP